MKYSRLLCIQLFMLLTLSSWSAVRAQCPDYVLLAPGIYSGSTCAAGNDCNLEASEEVEIQVEIPEDGLWTLSLCGSTFDTKLYIGSDCCLSDICFNDNSCSGGASECYCLDLLAGPHVVTIEGAAGACGAFTLTVSSCQAGDHGETCEDALIVGSLPYTADGNTCFFTGEYDFGCSPQVPSTPDVCYGLVGISGYVDIYLCTSGWAGKLYVVDSFWNVLGSSCGSSPCPGPGGGSGPRLLGLHLGGGAYCVVVDGMYGACGSYTLNITPRPCAVTCPPESTPEGEPNCYTGYVDDYNGGCYWGYRTWHPISCGQTVCGTVGNYWVAGNQRNDTDCFELDLTERDTVRWGCVAQFPAVVRIVTPGSGADPCAGNQIRAQQWATLPCETLRVEAVLDSGRHWVEVLMAVDNGISCGTPYYASLSCASAICPPVAELTARGLSGGSCELNWSSPGTGWDKVWSTTNPDHAGLDSTWALEANLLSSAGSQSWTDVVPAAGYKNYVVTHTCP
jgi:hypothetical protein